MRRLIENTAGALVLALALIIAAPAQAGPVDESRGVIFQQLDAFSRDAWDEAYSFASPGVKLSFPTVQSFSQMVQGGYPMVWQPKSVEYLDAKANGGQIVHRLLLVGPDERTYIATYVMAQIDGAWKVAAVYIEEAKEGMA